MTTDTPIPLDHDERDFLALCLFTTVALSEGNREVRLTAQVVAAKLGIADEYATAVREAARHLAELN